MHESEKRKRSCSVVSDPQRPHGLQPTRLLRPWDFPGKSTGVGWHCLLPPLSRMGLLTAMPPTICLRKKSVNVHISFCKPPCCGWAKCSSQLNKLANCINISLVNRSAGGGNSVCPSSCSQMCISSLWVHNTWDAKAGSILVSARNEFYFL